MKYICMHKPQNTNCEILVILNMGEISVYLHLKPASHLIKVNGTIHATHLNF